MTKVKDPTRERVNCKYGALMGRADTRALVGSDAEKAKLGPVYAGKLYLRRVRLDAGGYDQGGAYWGLGESLWCAFSPRDETVKRFWGPDAHEVLTYTRCATREAAKAEVREIYPEATFYR